METTMPMLEWDETFSVGVPAMDADNRRLFALINDLRGSISGGTDGKQMGKAITSLYNHFACGILSEEVRLYKNGYPALDEQVRDHDRYLGQLRRLYARFLAEDADGKILGAELIEVLTEYVREHVVRADRLFGEFLNGVRTADAPCWMNQDSWS
ncbi:MAG: hemerythrin family protein [Nitrospinae bacterium]|nr:hemerythrin family protein [Nitrospinota bacterium]